MTATHHKTRGKKLPARRKLLRGIRDLFAPRVGNKGDWYADHLPAQFQAWLHEPGKPVWTPREYARFAEEAYMRNVIAHRSVTLIAQSAASVPWQISAGDPQTGARIHLRQHPVLKLLAAPNPCCAGAEFMEAVISHRMIGGNAYILAAGPDGQKPRELYALRPDRVKVIAGHDGAPAGYEYTAGKKIHRYAADRLSGRSAILHLKQFHPLNDWYGMSPVEAAAYSIDQHNQASVWNQALLQNGAKPSGALVVKTAPDGSGGALSDDQFRRIRGQIDEHFTGAKNAGRPLLLEGGLDWKEMSLSPKDMDFIETKHSAARDIALAFGVPPQLLGIPGDNTYSNLAEARLALWEQTILPLLDHIAAALNHWLCPMFGPDLKLAADLDEVSALAPRREKVWARVNDAGFLSVDEKRRLVGLQEGGMEKEFL